MKSELGTMKGQMEFVGPPNLAKAAPIFNRERVGLYISDADVKYIVFPSGTVMFEANLNDWWPSAYEAIVVKDHFDFEGFIEAPCDEVL